MHIFIMHLPSSSPKASLRERKKPTDKDTVNEFNSKIMRNARR